jgi:hypothetical protein
MRKPFEVRAAGRSSTRLIPSCIHCGKSATKEALFKSGGFTIVEKYCDSCLQTENFTALMTFYGKNEKIASLDAT